MASNNVIKGDTVIFKNSYVEADITLRHNDSRHELQFGSIVRFQRPTQHTTVSLGGFDISLSDDRGSLVISKDNQVKFKIEG